MCKRRSQQGTKAIAEIGGKPNECAEASPVGDAATQLLLEWQLEFVG